MMLKSIFTMIGLGTFFAIILAIANQRLKVEEDPRIEELAQKLPGLNCGACGFPNCREFARAIIEGKIDTADTICRVAGHDVIELISKIAGIRSKPIKELAVVFCRAGNKYKTMKAEYKGINTCRSADIIFAGGMNCEYGCLGFGDCAKICPFDAIKIVDGLAAVDPDKCVACGKCVGACPRDIIGLMPYDADNLVITACSSKDSGAFVKRICAVGCIACKICERLSNGVFIVEDNLSKLDIKRMKEDVGWDEIIERCPTKTIVRIK